MVDVYLDLKNGHSGLHLVEKARSAVHGLGDKLQNQVEVDLILLDKVSWQLISCRVWHDCSKTYTFSIRIVEGFELYNIWVSDNAHDLQLTVLVVVSNSNSWIPLSLDKPTYLEALVLQDSFDGCVIPRGSQLCLKHNAK